MLKKIKYLIILLASFISIHPATGKNLKLIDPYLENTLTASPGYYWVKVLEINEAEASVKLHLRVTTPDSDKIYESVGFGLLLLDNEKIRNSLLATKMEFLEEFNDPKWVKKYANGFVKRVDKEDIRDGGDRPSAYITIYCTDKAWVSHMSVGDEWESYAYEISRTYDVCEPILYGEVAPEPMRDIDSSEYWMPVPGFMFEQGYSKLPNTVYIPRYTESAYMIDTIIEVADGEQDKINPKNSYEFFAQRADELQKSDLE